MGVRVDVVREASPPPVFGGVDVESVIERAVRAAFEDQGIADAELSLALMDDPGITAMNRQWLERDAATDVLAFALHDKGEPPLGDVYLGLEQAARQAEELGEDPARELARLAIHGTLHILGFDHPEEGREESEMWTHQERILARLDGA